MTDLLERDLPILSDMPARAERFGEPVPAALTAAAALGLAELLAGEAGRAPSGPALAATPLGARITFDTLRYRVLAERQSQRSLDEEVEQLADECRDLHDQLWEWRARVDAMKVALGRLKAPTPRPEAPLIIGAGGSSKRSRAERDRQLAGLSLASFGLSLAADQLEQLERLARDQGWGELWGVDPLFVALSYGLALGEQRDGLERDLAGPISTLSYRLFELRESTRILEIRRTALRIDNRGMTLRLSQFVEESAGLERELADGDGNGADRGRAWPRWPFRRS